MCQRMSVTRECGSTCACRIHFAETQHFELAQDVAVMQHDWTGARDFIVAARRCEVTAETRRRAACEWAKHTALPALGDDSELSETDYAPVVAAGAADRSRWRLEELTRLRARRLAAKATLVDTVLRTGISFVRLPSVRPPIVHSLAETAPRSVLLNFAAQAAIVAQYHPTPDTVSRLAKEFDCAEKDVRAVWARYGLVWTCKS